MRDVQSRLASLGFNPGRIDGAFGVKTKFAMMAALDSLEARIEADAPPAPALAGLPLIPPAWLPPARMRRIIGHWTGGDHEANPVDLEHYHLLVQGDGTIVRGRFPITANESGLRPGTYAAHTLNANTGAIGIALCAMRGGVEVPYSPGDAPVTEAQWRAFLRLVAHVARTYGIAPEPGTILTHAEVQTTLGIRQNKKWDIARLPFDWAPAGANAIGNMIRLAVRSQLDGDTSVPAMTMAGGSGIETLWNGETIR